MIFIKLHRYEYSKEYFGLLNMDFLHFGMQEDYLEFHKPIFLYKTHVSVVLDPLTSFHREIISGIIFRAAKKFVFVSKPVVGLGLKQLAGNGGATSKVLGGESSSMEGNGYTASMRIVVCIQFYCFTGEFYVVNQY